MKTQQDIYAASSKNGPPMLNKKNYVPWSSRLRYAKSRPNGKLIFNSIMNVPYVRRMILEPGDADRKVHEIWLRVQQMMKGFDIGIQEKKAKLFNEWERNKHFPEKIASNLKFLDNLQLEWSRRVTIVHHIKDLHIADYTQVYDFLKYNQKEVDELRVERLGKTHDPLALMVNSNNPFTYPMFHPDQPLSNCSTKYEQGSRQIDADGWRNENGLIVVPGIANQNLNGNGNVVTARAEGNVIGNNGNQIRCHNCRGLGHLPRNYTIRPRRRDVAYLQNQLLIAQKEEAGIQLQAEECDLMDATADLEEIEEVNANCILMANLQQASTSGTQPDKAPVYDSDGSAELLEPIPEPHQVLQNNSNVISDAPSVEQGAE
ncbi:hypothetical protein Tco_0053320 [Tanacetum coccineum]